MATSGIPLLNAVELLDYSSIPKEPSAGNDSVSMGSTCSSSSSTANIHKTTAWQAFISLTKGYVGVGVLSLPWAVSQLGIPIGVFGCFLMAYWSSYNCWTVVRLKRFIESNSEKADETASSVDGGGASSTATSVTYPDVGEWAYGQSFQSYVTACICTQQLAVCTVFMSFIGENLAAVLEFLGIVTNHVAVISMALPAVILLNFLPSLKALAPVMTAATIFVLIGFGVIGIILADKWENKPDEHHPTFDLPHAPLALCAVLYSYEGICLVLPVESAMKEPRHFAKVFWTSMTVVACIFSSFGAICVHVFGNVTNGSITAFLLQTYGQDESITFWIMVANAAVSLSILFTYPLQLWPALELVAPWWVQQTMNPAGQEEEDEKDLSGFQFEPLPPLLEHQATTNFEEIVTEQHDYSNAAGTEEEEEQRNGRDDASAEDEERSMISRVTATVFPALTMPGDSPLLRASLVLLTYLVAVVVPNVQSLISLAGALAGSSTALLIPPALELAYLRHLERDGDDNGKSSFFVPKDKWKLERIKCYFLILMGFIFCVIGTAASLRDIISIYRGV
jgi:proton-coupled amino acid transporter